MDGLKLIAKLLEDGATQALRELTPDKFFKNEREVYQYVRRHYRRYHELPDIATVESELDIELPETPESYEFYHEKVEDRRAYNSFKEPFSELRQALAGNDIPAARAAIGMLSDASRVHNTQQDIRNLRELGDSILRNADLRLRNDDVPGITTGWAEIDEQLDGGYQNGDLVTWAARPGMGKTYYLLHQAIAAWQSGRSVLVVSMEMTLEQLGNRAFGMMNQINPNAIRRGQLTNRSRRKLTNHIHGLEGADHFHLYAGNFRKNVEDVEHTMQELNPDIVYIDGVYLMRTEKGFGKRQGRYEIATDVFDYLKEMTITHARPIVATTKFNKAAGKKGADATLETIGYTDAAGTHSSIVIGLKEGVEPNQDTTRQVEIMKGREGEEGIYHTHFCFGPMNFGLVDPNELQQMREQRQQETDGNRLGDADWEGNVEGED